MTEQKVKIAKLLKPTDSTHTKYTIYEETQAKILGPPIDKDLTPNF